MVHVAVVSNACLWREALCSLLEKSANGLHVLAHGEFQHLLELMAKGPDIWVLDAGHSVEADLVRRTLATLSGRLAVIAGSGEELEDILRWFETGASGYVSWASSGNHLVRVVLETAQRQSYCSSEVAGELLKRFHKARKLSASDSRVSLTPREKEIEAMLLLFQTKEIAQRLHIEVSTVKNHLHQIYKKRHVHGRLEAIRAMTLKGIAVNPEDLDRSN